jgi:Flp pilus assembly protein protease CpaA
MYVTLLFFLMLGICLYTDIKQRRIPNIVTFPMFLIGLGLTCYEMLQTDGINGVILTMCSLFIGAVICEKLLIRKKFWAHGDAKLFLAAAAWFPPITGILAILGLYIFFHFAYAMLYRLLKKRNRLIPAKFPGSILIVVAVFVHWVTEQGGWL